MGRILLGVGRLALLFQVDVGVAGLTVLQVVVDAVRRALVAGLVGRTGGCLDIDRLQVVKGNPVDRGGSEGGGDDGSGAGGRRRLDVRALAGRVLPREAAAEAGAGAHGGAPDGLRDQWHLYSLQKPESFAKWRDETPDGFVFALKGSRYIVNRRELAGAGEAMPRFFGSGMSELGSKLGPFLWQFAHTKKFDPDDFARFLDLLPRELEGLPLRHALEPRHDSFKDDRFIALAQERGFAVVYAEHDTYPQIEAHGPDFAYARVQQTREEVQTGYEAAELDRIAGMARGWAAEGRDVFLFVISGRRCATGRGGAISAALIALHPGGAYGGPGLPGQRTQPGGPGSRCACR
jgi:hypothetical protein